MNQDKVNARASIVVQENITELAKLGLHGDEILTFEFDYIAQSAFQANEDRARVSTYYIVTLGTLVAALFSLRVGSGDLQRIHLALFVVFLTLALFGISTLFQLVQLRLAWRACAIAMNTMKEYYIERFEPLSMGKAFKWRMRTVPDAFKVHSVAYLLALQVALLGGVSLGTSFYFLGVYLTPGNPSAREPWLVGALIGLLYILLAIGHYKGRLNEGQEQQDGEFEAETIRGETISRT